MHLSAEHLAKKIKKLTWNQDPDVAADTERRLKTLNSIRNRGYFTDKDQREEYLDNRQFGNTVALRLYGGKGLRNKIPDTLTGIRIPTLSPRNAKYQQVLDYAVKKQQMGYQGSKYLIVDMALDFYRLDDKAKFDSISYKGYAKDILISNAYLISEVDETENDFVNLLSYLNSIAHVSANVVIRSLPDNKRLTDDQKKLLDLRDKIPLMIIDADAAFAEYDKTINDADLDLLNDLYLFANGQIHDEGRFNKLFEGYKTDNARLMAYKYLKQYFEPELKDLGFSDDEIKDFKDSLLDPTRRKSRKERFEKVKKDAFNIQNKDPETDLNMLIDKYNKRKEILIKVYDLIQINAQTFNQSFKTLFHDGNTHKGYTIDYPLGVIKQPYSMLYPIKKK